MQAVGMKANGIVAVVPMKPLRMTKSRLASRLSPPQRVALSLSMFHIVVQAALESSVVEVWVIGGDKAVNQLAIELGSRWFEDEGPDLNGSLSHAFRRAFNAGLAPLYLPADLPFLAAEDIDSLVQASENGKKLVLSPAHRDGGTNAMLVPPGSAFHPALGIGSFQRHKEQAASLGIPFAVCDSSCLGLDLDTPADLDTCEKLEPGFLERLMSLGKAKSIIGCAIE
jgi:2-phospho-L-lactate guanylyltransferase